MYSAQLRGKAFILVSEALTHSLFVFVDRLKLRDWICKGGKNDI